MAEIDIERRPQRSGWNWLALLLVLLGVAIGAWLLFGDPVDEGAAPPAAEQVEPIIPEPEPLIPERR